MIELNTRRLFHALLQPLHIDTVCDVGSMDGTEARAFRTRLPRARIVALEPSPENMRRMRADASLDAARIELIDAAAAAQDGCAPFFVVAADYSAPDERRGQSSMWRRDAPPSPLEEVQVRTLRLDTLLGTLAPTPARVALWIDAEGLAYEVLVGARAILPKVQLLHVELETQPCINSGQRLAADVFALLAEQGFDEIATDVPRHSPQINAVFLRRGQDAASLRRLEGAIAWGRVRRRGAKLLRRI